MTKVRLLIASLALLVPVIGLLIAKRRHDAQAVATAQGFGTADGPSRN